MDESDDSWYASLCEYDLDLPEDTVLTSFCDSPLCVEEFDLQDKSFRPCPCQYQVNAHLTLSTLRPSFPIL